MSSVGKRKPTSSPKVKGGKAAKRAPEPESGSEEAEEPDDDEEEASEEGSDGGEGLSDSDEEDSEEEGEHGGGMNDLDELDDEEFEGDDLELDEYGGDSESDGAAEDDEFDAEGGDEGSDEEDDDEDEEETGAEGGRATAAAAAASRSAGSGGANMFGFARAFSNLVGEDEKGAAGEVLPKTKKQRRVEAEQKREKKVRSSEKKKKLELRERGHVVPTKGVVDTSSDQLERRMIQTATRGVVRLFNAVSKAQRAAADASKQRGVGSAKSKLLTKSKFLADLKKSPSASSKVRVVEVDEEEEGGEGGKTRGGAGWDVLSDGYLMGRNKLKDWDKGTREAEAEVEYEDEDLE